MKKGDTVYWQDLKGEIINDKHLLDYPLFVKFNNGDIRSFTKDGRHLIGLPPILSLTPYTLEGFSQEKPIEKDTLVYVTDYEDNYWGMRYYSHFEDGKHYCFASQKKSTETDEISYWKYCQVENPLL